MLYMKIPSGVLCRENIPLFGHGDMRINFCDIDRAVPQDFLNVADVYVSFQKACGERVPEHMRRDMQVDSGQGGVAVYHPADSLVGQFIAVLVCKKMSTALDF